MGEYSGLQAMAARMVAKKGTYVVVTRTGIASQDPVAGTVTPDPATATLSAVVMAPTRGAMFAAQTLNKVAAKEFTFALLGAALTPAPGDVVELPSGERFTLFHVQVTDPNAASPIIAVGYAEAGP